MPLQAVYTPPKGLRTALDDFREYVNKSYHLQLSRLSSILFTKLSCGSGQFLSIHKYLESYDELHDFSINRLNDFWMSLWKFTGIRASVHPTKIS